MKQIKSFLETAKLARKQVHRNLTMNKSTDKELTIYVASAIKFIDFWKNSETRVLLYLRLGLIMCQNGGTRRRYQDFGLIVSMRSDSLT